MLLSLEILRELDYFHICAVSRQILQKGKFLENIGRNFLIMNVVRYWNNLPREAMYFLTEHSLRNLFFYGLTLGREKDQVASRGPF